MATAVICLILVVICVFAVRSYGKRLSSGCCGSGSEKSVKKIKVQDKNKEHYPYQATLEIDGMVCGNCAARVENALNGLDGVWAQADLGSKTAFVRMKSQIDTGVLKDAVREAGYVVLKVK